MALYYFDTSALLKRRAKQASAAEIVFVASDKELVEAAEKAGLAVLDPESEDALISVVSRVIVYNNPKRRLSENSPPQPRRGGCADQEKAAKLPKPAQTGWCWSTTAYFV